MISKSFAKTPDRTCTKGEAKEAHCSNKRENKICIFSDNRPRCAVNIGQGLPVREIEGRKREKQERKNNEKKHTPENVGGEQPRENNKKEVKP